MRDGIDRTAVLLLLALGGAHAALAPLLFDPRQGGLVWFVGTGLALVFLALLNLARRAAGSAEVERMCFVANLLGCGLGALVLRSVTEAQAIAAMVALVVLTVVSAPAPHRLLQERSKQ